VARLDDYILGQADAKRAAAIALHNRWRRYLLPAHFKNEMIPKNTPMTGPTGCRKTEIARRLAALSEAPLIKVEATRFTEVGFYGKDVDHIIHDLAVVGIMMAKRRAADMHRAAARASAEVAVLELFAATQPDEKGPEGQSGAWLKALRRGDLKAKCPRSRSRRKLQSPRRETRRRPCCPYWAAREDHWKSGIFRSRVYCRSLRSRS